MWPFGERKQRYEPVAGEDGSKEEQTLKTPVHNTRWTVWCSVILGLTVLVIGVFGLAVFSSRPAHHSDESTTSSDDIDTELEASPFPVLPPTTTTTTTSKCPLRREWRTLAPSEQQAYISAVLCLREQPSTLAPSSNHTAYDDFPWIHSHVGYFTHNSAPFLPWHRYFLHIYEQTLRTQCGYEDGLVYWDWTLDSQALEESPVFDVETGFGGDGEVGGEITVGRSGRCLVNGPFAGVTVDYYDVQFKPHCLSRGFRDLDGNLGHIDGHEISPDSIEGVLGIDGYEEFVAKMESKVHDTIPFGIGGDFETFTAPYDPIFFLHHTQLDRLWWLWQHRGDGERLTAYGGHKERHSMVMASLEDDIDMRRLAGNVKVSEMMDTENDLLCYSY